MTESSFNPMYFPPPPTTTTTTTPATAKKSLKLSFKSRQNLQPTQQKPILKQPINPTRRPRQYILLALLVLSFTILILSMIYAYCTALPHSDNPSASVYTDPEPVEPTTTATLTMINISSAASQATSVAPARRDAPTPTSTDYASSTSLAALAAQDAEDKARFSRPSAMASLVFYTALLPLLTMTHTTCELLFSMVKPSSSQHSRLGDLILNRGPTSSRRIGTLLSFSISATLVLGWFIQILFWTNCEISSFSSSGANVCPIQIRGHHMGGVDELSIGKVALGWLLILVYVGYLAFLVVQVGVFGRKKVSGAGAGFLRKARFANKSTDRADVESIVIGIQMKETR